MTNTYYTGCSVYDAANVLRKQSGEDMLGEIFRPAYGGIAMSHNNTLTTLINCKNYFMPGSRMIMNYEFGRTRNKVVTSRL
jgi:hypothetical protein